MVEAAATAATRRRKRCIRRRVVRPAERFYQSASPEAVTFPIVKPRLLSVDRYTIRSAILLASIKRSWGECWAARSPVRFPTHHR